MSKLGVLWVHGMGNHGPDYADKATDELRDRLDAADVDPQAVVFQSAHWSDVLDGRENAMLKRLAQSCDVDWLRVRRELVVGGLGDACAYLGPGRGASPYYDIIHKRIEKGLAALRGRLDLRDKAPVVIMAHSLGCAVVADYLLDAQAGEGRGKSPLTRGETVASLVTFGCNLPLFTLCRAPKDVKVPRVPGSAAAQAFRNRKAFSKHAGWYNFYDPDDVLGFPLRPLGPQFSRVVKKDLAINTGAIWRAHTGYWTDNDFTRPVARLLAGLVRAI